MNPQLDTLVRQAAEAIRRADPRTAMDLLRRAEALAPEHADVHNLFGVALTQDGQPALATVSFRRAVELAPESPKARFNLAVHLEAQGGRSEAERLARSVLETDPSHAEADAMLARLDPSHRPAPRQSARAPLELRPGHYELLFGRMGLPKAWLPIGWGLLGLALIVLVVRLAFNPLSVTLGPKGEPRLNLVPGPVALIAVFALIVSALGSLLWMLVDLMDRRGRVVWIAPLLGAVFCGLHALPLGLYLLLRTRNTDPGNPLEPSRS